jgi:DNA polymerase III epsilon subunit-like protein
MYVEIAPAFPGVDPRALEVCGLDLDRLRREGAPAHEAMARIRAWVLARNAGSSERPVFVGHNAVFDWSYVNYYFAYLGLENPFGYKAIDSKSLAMGRLGVGWNETSKERLERLLGLPPQDPAQIHRADYDAHYQALILQKLLDHEGSRGPA